MRQEVPWSLAARGSKPALRSSITALQFLQLVALLYTGVGPQAGSAVCYSVADSVAYNKLLV
eukprot:133992-Chlamydomonas_euryale.AAC.1